MTKKTKQEKVRKTHRSNVQYNRVVKKWREMGLPKVECHRLARESMATVETLPALLKETGQHDYG